MDYPGSLFTIPELFRILNRKLDLADGSDQEGTDKVHFESTSEVIKPHLPGTARIESGFRRYKNSFRAVNKLPDKILATIFELFKPSPPSETRYLFPIVKDLAFCDGPGRNFSTALDWIKVSWVCHHWRKVALKASTLWTKVLWQIMYHPHIGFNPYHEAPCVYQNGNPGQTVFEPNIETTDACVAFIERSGKEPLHIKQFEIYKENRNPKLNIVASFATACYGLSLSPFYDALKLHTHRVKVWEIRTQYLVHEDIWEVLTLPFPMISEFHLKVNSQHDSRSWEDSQANAPGSITPVPRYSFPMLFGQREVPTLRQLSIWRYSRWPHNSFPNLTHLSLNEQYIEHRPSVDEFLDVLEAAPLLEYLHIELAGPIVLGGFVPPPRLVPLRFLRRIDLHWRPIDDLKRQYPPMLMQCLEMPLDVEIIYESVDVFDGEEDFYLDLPPEIYLENVTLLRVLLSGRDHFWLKKEMLYIDSSSFQWFNNFAQHVPNLETLFFVSDGKLNNRFPNFTSLKHIHIAIMDGLIYLMRALAHPVPCCASLEDVTVHGRFDPTKDIEDATETEKRAVETVLREGEVVINRRLLRKTYRLISEKTYLTRTMFSSDLPSQCLARVDGPFKWHYKFSAEDEYMYQ